MHAFGTALVTGANRGLGRALALELGRRGFAVIATARDPESAASLVADADAAGIRLTVQRLDVTAVTPLDLPDDLRVVVNNAGMQAGYLPVEVVPLELVRVMLETNVVGPIAVLQQAIPILRARGEGVICTITSAGLLLAAPFHGAYRASKAAASALGETLCTELAPFGIRVLEVLPGPIDTDGLAGSAHLEAVDHPPYRAVAERMMASRDAVRAATVTPEAAASRIVDEILADARPLRTSCDPMGDELLTAWRRTSDEARLERDLDRYAPGAAR